MTATLPATSTRAPFSDVQPTPSSPPSLQRLIQQLNPMPNRCFGAALQVVDAADVG